MNSNQKFAASERRALEPLTGEENDAVLALLARARTLLEVQRLELIQSQMAQRRQCCGVKWVRLRVARIGEARKEQRRVRLWL